MKIVIHDKVPIYNTFKVQKVINRLLSYHNYSQLLISNCLDEKEFT